MHHEDTQKSLVQRIRDSRQSANEDQGLFCYCREINPCEWSLWRDDPDQQLTEWRDLGPDGFIWVLWTDGNELIVVLEYRDDTANPPELRQGLLHLPSGQETGLIFTGEIFGNYWGTEEFIRGKDDVLFAVYPHEDVEAGAGRVGMGLYDRHLREVLPPIAYLVRPTYEFPGLVEVWLLLDDNSIVRAIYDYRTMRYLVPAEYEDIFFHKGRWFGNTAAGQCHIRLADGTPFTHYDYTLHQLDNKDIDLYVERQGLWGKADSEGRIVVEPYAASMEALNDEVLKFSRLTLAKSEYPPIVVAEKDLQKLIVEAAEHGFCFKYEGIDLDGYGDGYVDVSVAELPKAGGALVVDDRYGDLRLLVLTVPWRKLPRGSVLRLHGKSRLRAAMRNSTEDLFLQGVLAQSVGWS